MATCEVWVRGTFVTGGFLQYRDIIAYATYDTSQGFPVLTVTSTESFGAATVRRYSATPQWSYTDRQWSTVPEFYYKNCKGIDPNQGYDCLNGQCIPATSYRTPGKYANLATCQAGCAKDANCTGECIPATEIAALQQAANIVRSRICK
jgi:hypothetical protein